MAARPGTRPPNAGKGRKHGSQNKVSKELKDMILGALDAAGGENYLKRQAKESPAAFLGLVGKVLPKDLNVKVPGALHLSISLSRHE